MPLPAIKHKCPDSGVVIGFRETTGAAPLTAVELRKQHR